MCNGECNCDYRKHACKLAGNCETFEPMEESDPWWKHNEDAEGRIGNPLSEIDDCDSGAPETIDYRSFIAAKKYLNNQNEISDFVYTSRHGYIHFIYIDCYGVYRACHVVMHDGHKFYENPKLNFDIIAAETDIINILMDDETDIEKGIIFEYDMIEMVKVKDSEIPGEGTAFLRHAFSVLKD